MLLLIDLLGRSWATIGFQLLETRGYMEMIRSPIGASRVIGFLSWLLILPAVTITMIAIWKWAQPPAFLGPMAGAVAGLVFLLESFLLYSRINPLDTLTTAQMIKGLALVPVLGAISGWLGIWLGKILQTIRC